MRIMLSVSVVCGFCVCVILGSVVSMSMCVVCSRMHLSFAVCTFSFCLIYFARAIFYDKNKGTILFQSFSLVCLMCGVVVCLGCWCLVHSPFVFFAGAPESGQSPISVLFGVLLCGFVFVSFLC